MDDAFPGDTGHVNSVGDSLFVHMDCASLNFYNWMKVKEMGSTQMHVSMHCEIAVGNQHIKLSFYI